MRKDFRIKLAKKPLKPIKTLNSSVIMNELALYIQRLNFNSAVSRKIPDSLFTNL